MRKPRMDGERKLEIRLYGGLCTLSGAASLLLYYANTFAKAHGGHDLTPIVRPGVFLIFLGIALLCLQVWAELLFILCITAIGATLLIGSLILAHNTPWVLLNVPFALILFVPLLLNVRQLRIRTYFQHGV